MHDTAVGTANFTGYVLVPTNGGSGVPGDCGTVTASQPPMACNGVHQSSAVGFRGIRTSERSPDAQVPVVRLGCGMIRFNNCLWATLQDVRKLLSP
ncbi:MAG TPA: hypothetical protein VFO87_00340, partial [Nitrospira sp.]|nr:hypothetical protein [Nitrospira sp.]